MYFTCMSCILDGQSKPYHSPFSVLVVLYQHERPNLRDGLPQHKCNGNTCDQHHNENKLPVFWSLHT